MHTIVKDPIFTIPSWVKTYSSINLIVMFICLFLMFQYHFKIEFQAKTECVETTQANIDFATFFNDRSGQKEYLIFEKDQKKQNAYLTISPERRYLFGKIFEKNIKLKINNKIIKGKITEMVSILDGKIFVLKINIEEKILSEAPVADITIESISCGKMLKEYILRN